MKYSSGEEPKASQLLADTVAVLYRTQIIIDVM
jgi:hypothetical protein